MAPRLPPIRKKPAWELALEALDANLAACDGRLEAVRQRLSEEHNLTLSLKQKVARKRIALGLKAKERTQEAELEKRYWASTKIQAFYRGRLAQRAVDAKRKRRDNGTDLLGVSIERMKLAAHLSTLTVLCHNLVYTPQHQQRMAKVLVKWWRQVLRARQRVVLLMHDDIVDSAATLQGATMMVQAHVRRMQACRRVARLRAERRAREAVHEEEVFHQRVVASVVISRFGRGLLARRVLNERRDQMRSLGAKKDASGAWVMPSPGRTKVDAHAQRVRDGRETGVKLDAGVTKPKFEERGGRTNTSRSEKSDAGLVRESNDASPGVSPTRDVAGARSPRKGKPVRGSTRARQRKTRAEEEARQSMVEKKKPHKPRVVPREDALRRAKEQAAGLFSANVTRDMCELLRHAVAQQDDPPPRMAHSTYVANPDFEELARTLFTVRF